MAANILIVAIGLFSAGVSAFISVLDMNSFDSFELLPEQRVLCGQNATLKIMHRISTGVFGNLYSGIYTAKDLPSDTVTSEQVSLIF